MNKVKFRSEAEMCQQFIEAVPDTWTVYPESCGFDILLSRKDDGFQIGIEAKLVLNAKVILQAAESVDTWSILHPGPDCRAVLVPNYVGYDLTSVCRRLGIEVIRLSPKGCMSYQRNHPFRPELPGKKYSYLEHAKGQEWFEFCPNRKIPLPEFISDAGAGNPSPLTLTHWKIGAIKLAITLEKRGFLTRKDFKFFDVSMSRWTQGGMTAWLRAKEYGVYVGTDRIPDFRQQHPVNYAEIESLYEKWKNPEHEISQVVA
ncbi:hypothetical protein [Dyadobacter sp. CY323]|uniref:hypothetical protein n=1 Tax=Dyadobacter sp. CY323 TaxID=2907302 RepID=UPI001F410609|nr:hypothetical protein [Dyadobacter sp. CY323]MCE6993076.1 hypothetical protein [Dyadobacter sp. CY323]